MQMVPGSPRKPGANLFVFMSRVVVHDEMHIQLWRRVRINMMQELQKLLMPMVDLRLSKNTPSSNVQCSEEGQSVSSQLIVPIRSRSKFLVNEAGLGRI